jgi:hypothetical protein
MKKNHFLFFAIIIFGLNASAQQPVVPSGKPYSYIIKGGHVIDPKNNIDEIVDIAVTSGTRAQAARPAMAARPAANGRPARPAMPAREAIAATEGKVALVAKNINPDLADKIIDAKGLYVTPGLIDIHVHFFWGHDGSYLKNAATALPADGFTFRTGRAILMKWTPRRPLRWLKNILRILLGLNWHTLEDVPGFQLTVQLKPEGLQIFRSWSILVLQIHFCLLIHYLM